jgi:TusA-related sulfurtransferase
MMEKESLSEKNTYTNEADVQAEITLDLTGKKCPMTFVHTKLALEKLQPLQVLKVILDYEPSFTNVPRSVELQHLGTIVQERQEGNERKTLWICKSQHADRE